MTATARVLDILRARVAQSSCRVVALDLGVTGQMVWRWTREAVPLPAWVIAVVLRGADPGKAQARLGTRARRGYGALEPKEIA